MFFHTVPHEVAHISAYEEKNDTETKKVLKGMDNIFQEYNNLPLMDRNNPQVKRNYFIMAENYRMKHKKVIDKWKEERKKSHGNHWENPWYSDYIDFHNNLMKSPFFKYNYHNKPPLSYEECWED